MVLPINTNKHVLRRIKTSQGEVAFLDSNPGFSSDDPTLIFIHGHCTNKQFFNAQLGSSLFAKYR